jgi:ADP-heptose:LPS heptosyltransferase
VEPAQTYQKKFGRLPERILLLKGHSAGIGDILRGSAAWRALRNVFPAAELHLGLLTEDPGAASEAFIARHHLLQSFFAVDKRTNSLGDWKTMIARLNEAGARIRPDLIIDFEPAGLKSSIGTWVVGRRCRAVTAGIAQFPGRGFFYRLAAESTMTFARRRGLEFPLEYTNRDFVCLAAFGIERNGTPIELEETEEAKRFGATLRKRIGVADGIPLIGLNIGCGTPDAIPKRPDLRLLKSLVETVQKNGRAELVLTGAKFEQPVNKEFISLLAPDQRSRCHDLAGQTSLLELCSLIRACAFFISTDSGPYHMAVALKVPTLAVFRGPNPVHYHHEKHVRCLVLTKEAHVTAAVHAAQELMRCG